MGLLGKSIILGGKSSPPFSATSSINLDGVSKNISFGNNTFGIDVSSSFSISVWFKPASHSGTVGSGPIFNKMTAGALGWELYYGGGQVDFGFFGNGNTLYAITDFIFAPGLWYHVVVTYNGVDANGINIYVNGVLVTVTRTNTKSGSVANSSSAKVGVRDTTRFLNAKVTQLAVFSGYVLSAGEVTAIFNGKSPTSITSSNLTNWYWMGQGTDSTSTIFDRKGSINGTPVNIVSGDITSDVPAPDTSFITKYQTPYWWFRGDTKILNGSNVATWPNKGSGVNDAITPVGNTSYQPPWSSSITNLNNKPAVSFQNTVTGLDVGNDAPLSISQPFLLILVINLPQYSVLNGGTTYGFPVFTEVKTSDGGGDDLAVIVYNNTGALLAEVGSKTTWPRMGANTGFGTGFSTPQKLLFEICYNGSGVSNVANWDIWINKVQKTVTNQGHYNGAVTANNSLGSFLQPGFVPDEQGPGDYGDLLVYKNWGFGLNSSKQADIRGELATRYNF